MVENDRRNMLYAIHEIMMSAFFDGSNRAHLLGLSHSIVKPTLRAGPLPRADKCKTKRNIRVMVSRFWLIFEICDKFDLLICSTKTE